MIITIDTNTGFIEIKKEWQYKTIPDKDTPIQYHQINIHRKYFKKWDPEYHRKPLTKTALKSSKFDRIVKQEPLLDLYS